MYDSFAFATAMEARHHNAPLREGDASAHHRISRKEKAPMTRFELTSTFLSERILKA